MKPIQTKNSLFVYVLTSIFTVSLAATTCGTFAWFTYATRAYIDYHGVTIGAGQLQLGFVTTKVLDKADDYNLGIEDEYVQKDENGEYILSDSTPLTERLIYWVPGNTDGEMMKYILGEMGYATNILTPVTSGPFASGDELSLRDAPSYNHDAEDQLANKDFYINLPLVFRYSTEEEPNIYIPDFDVYMSESKLTCAKNVHEAVRMYIAHDDESYIINLTADSDGSDEVGGVLDLNRDGYYDYLTEGSEDDDLSMKETPYGFFTNDVVYSSPVTDEGSIDGDYTTFNALHKEGVEPLDVEAMKPELANYVGGTQFNEMYTPITVTNSQTYNYGYMDMTIYLEGWDYALIDSEQGTPFSLDLAFSVVS